MAKLKTVRGNVFRDLSQADAELKQLKALLAAEIVRVLDEQALTVRQAAALSGQAAADFSRIRGAELERFTVDRMMKILGRLGREMNISVKVKRRKPTAGQALQAA